MEVFTTILQLLSVIEKQVAVAPQMVHLSGAAMAKLKEINDEMAKVAAEKAAAEAKKAAELEAKRLHDTSAQAAKAKVDELEAQKKAEADLRARAAQAPKHPEAVAPVPVRPHGEPAQRAEDVGPSSGMRV